MVEELDVIDFKSKLPNDIYRVLGFKVNGVKLDSAFLLQDGFIYFPTDIDFDKVTLEYIPKTN
jgi:hypothetical protein